MTSIGSNNGLRSSEARQMLPQYKYEALPPTGSFFRLVRVLPGSGDQPLRCHITTSEIMTTSVYDALSYEWGDPADRAEIEVNGAFVTIPRNLHHFLHQLRETPSPIALPLFADAICINQKDLAERSSQVSLMGKIFRTAARVRVWLGQTQPSATKLFAVLNYISKGMGEQELRQKYRDIFGDVQLQSFYENLCEFSSFSYWSRVWIVQELFLAEAIILYCGNDSMNWDQFEDVCVYMMPDCDFFKNEPVSTEHWIAFRKSYFRRLCTQRLILRLPEATPLTTEYQLLAIEDRVIWKALTNRRGERLVLPLQVLIAAYGQSGCTDKRDRVYGFLGLTNFKLDGALRIMDDTRTSFFADYAENPLTTFGRVMEFSKPIPAECIAFSRQLRQALELEHNAQAGTSGRLQSQFSPPVLNHGFQTRVLVRYAGKLKWRMDPYTRRVLPDVRTTPTEPNQLSGWHIGKKMKPNARYDPGDDELVTHSVCCTLDAVRPGDVIYRFVNSDCAMIFRYVSSRFSCDPNGPPVSFLGRAVLLREQDPQPGIDFLKARFEYGQQLARDCPYLRIGGIRQETCATKVSLTELLPLTVALNKTDIPTPGSDVGFLNTRRVLQYSSSPSVIKVEVYREFKRLQQKYAFESIRALDGLEDD